MNNKQEIVKASKNKALTVSSPSEQSVALLGVLKEVALAPNVNVDAMRAILDMQRQLQQDQAERSLNEALSRLDIPHVKKNGKIPLKDKDGNIRDLAFAKWEDIDTVIRPLLRTEGFSLSFTAPARVGDGGGATMTGWLAHREGAKREATISLPLDTGPGRNNLQAMGSTISYGKKYLAFMLLNIVTEGVDDDGNSAEPIDAKQAEALKNKIKETNSDVKRFLKLFGVDAVDKIQKRDFEKAVALLAVKEQKAAQDKQS